MSAITATYGTKRGGSGARSVRTEAEALRLLKGACHVTTVALRNDAGEVVGARERTDAADDRRVKWAWWLDSDAFKRSPL